MPANKFKVENTLLPRTTKTKIGSLEDIDNFALKLNKCVNWFKKDTFDSGVSEIGSKRIGNAKLDALKYKKDKTTNEEFRIDANFSKVKINDILTNHRNNADALCFKTEKVSNLKSNWRMVIGLGNESVFETSMTLHHVYGIPYIPASGIKGVIRNWVINEKFNSNESEALKNEEFVKIFGSDAGSGKVIFFDAFPVNLRNDSIQPDIINPHYSEYYDGNKPPADWQNPVPVFFLTLKDTHFEFIFGVKNSDYTGLLEILTKSETGWLYRALAEQGIGAKTAVGYGRMYEPEKAKPNFLGGNSKLNPKRRHNLEGIVVTVEKNKVFASVYIREGNIQEAILLNGNTSSLKKNDIIKIEVSVNDKENITQATFIGNKQLQKPP